MTDPTLTARILAAATSPRSVSGIMRRCSASRAVVVAALDQLRADGKVSCCRTLRGHAEWRALAPFEIEAKQARRALLSELRRSHEAFRAVGDISDICEELPILMRLPDETRERIAVLAEAYYKIVENEP